MLKAILEKSQTEQVRSATVITFHLALMQVWGAEPHEGLIWDLQIARVREAQGGLRSCAPGERKITFTFSRL